MGKARSPNGLACAKIQEHTTLFNRAKIVWKNQRFGLFKKNASSDFFCVSQRDFPMDFSHSPALIPVMVTGVPASAVLATPRPSSWMVSWKTPKNALGAPPYDLGNPHEP